MLLQAEDSWDVYVLGYLWKPEDTGNKSNAAPVGWKGSAPATKVPLKEGKKPQTAGTPLLGDPREASSASRTCLKPAGCSP